MNELKIAPSFRYAGQVSVGDEVLVQGKYYLTPATVINVSSLIMQGDNIFIIIFLVYQYCSYHLIF